jgi:hypothetical protein
MSLEVVLARYKERIEWTKELTVGLLVYNKGGLGPGLSLPNVGREAHTYLHHICENYGNLPEWTFFSQADPNRHIPVQIFWEIINRFPETQRQCILYCPGGPMFFSSEPVRYNEGYKDQEDWESGVGDVWEALFTRKLPEDILFSPASIFVISRQKLLSRSLAFYRMALELASTRERGPWEFERLWAYLWRAKDTPFVRL